MPSLADIIRILNDGPLSFKFAILIGVVLIIIAVAPSLIIPILKAPSITLTRNQSIILGVIGAVLILSGLAGIWISENKAPNINAVYMVPNSPITAFEIGTPIRITVNATDEYTPFYKHSRLEYKSYLSSPDLKNKDHKYGPSTESNFTIYIFPDDIGEKIIMINVTDSINETYFAKNFLITPANQEPVVKNLAITQLDKGLRIEANATDPEKDKLFYYFYQKAVPSAERPIEIPPEWNLGYDSRVRYWSPPNNGQYSINVFVRDGDRNGPWDTHENATKEALIDINGTNMTLMSV